jgi:cell division septation protein DedD
MTARNKPQGLDGLADVLVEDILCTSGEQLLAEVAEDYGNPRALAVAFDKIVLRARSSHDRLVAKASPIVASQILDGPRTENESSRLAEPLRALWQNVLPSIVDLIFPNRLIMIGISSACIASLAVIVVAPKFFDGVQEQHSGVPAGTKTIEGGRPRQEPYAEGPANERGVTRGLVPAPSSSSPAVPGDIHGVPSTETPVPLRPDGTPGGADGSQASTPSVPVTAAREPPVAKSAASPSGAPGVASVPSPAADNYLVQISSQRSRADAQASLRSMQAKFPKELGDRKATVRRADLGPKGIYYRALVGPFGSAGDADRFCSNLKAAGGQCMVEKE